MEIKDKHWSKIEKELQTNQNLWSKPDGKEHGVMWKKERGVKNLRLTASGYPACFWFSASL